MSRVYHPDKHVTEELKSKAEKLFNKIKKAHEGCLLVLVLSLYSCCWWIFCHPSACRMGNWRVHWQTNVQSVKSYAPLHLRTSKVIVIVWRLRGNIIRLFNNANMLPLNWAQLTETVHTARLGLEFVFLGWMIYLYIRVCFVLPWTVESFPFMFWNWHNKLKWALVQLFCSLPITSG